MRANKNLNNLTNMNIIWSKLKYQILKILNIFLSDRKFIKIQQKHHKFKKIDYKNPRTLAEKIIFLKLHYKTPLITLCSDKLTMREYVKIHGLDNHLANVKYIIKNKFDLKKEYENNKSFIVKGSNRSGGSILVNHDEMINVSRLNKYIKFLLKSKYFYYGREWGYKNNKNRVYFEELLGSNEDRPIDYKFYCFSGEPKYFMISKGEFEGNVQNHKFDLNGESIDFKFKKEATLNKNNIQISNLLPEMLKAVEKLCKPFPHVRIDLLVLKDKFYIGEFTFYSSSGFINVLPEYEIEMGKLIELEHYKSDIYKI